MAEENKKMGGIGKISFNRANKNIKNYTASRVVNASLLSKKNQGKNSIVVLKEPIQAVSVSYSVEYVESVMSFIDGLDSAKKYKNLGLVVDSPPG